MWESAGALFQQHASVEGAYGRSTDAEGSIESYRRGSVFVIGFLENEAKFSCTIRKAGVGETMVLWLVVFVGLLMDCYLDAKCRLGARRDWKFLCHFLLLSTALSESTLFSWKSH